MHLAAALGRLSRWYPERTALIDPNGTWTFGQFVARVNRLGNALRGQGLNNGDRVALLLPDIREYLEADYGTMSAGLVRVPVDPRLNRKELTAQLAHAGVRALITHSMFGEKVEGLAAELDDLKLIVGVGGRLAGVQGYEALLQRASDRPLPAGSGEDLAALNFSGGTTSAPKAIMLQHRNLLAAAQNMIQGFSIGPDQVFLNVRPMWPIAQIQLLSHVLAGAAVVLADRFEPESLAGLIMRCRADRTSLVPTQLVRFTNHLERSYDSLQCLKTVHVGGSSIPPSVFERALAVLGPRIGVHYGLTEAPVTTYLPPDRLDPKAGQHHLIDSVGRELFSSEVRIASNGTDSHPGDGGAGEVLIRGGHVMAGYWRDESATRRALREGWLHTGDLGRIDEHGDIYIVGRLKDVIRSGSTTIVPKEIEDVIARHPAVAEVAVLGVPDTEWGEAVTAFVALNPDAAASQSELIEYARSQLSTFKVPKSVRFVTALPRSHYGKVLRTQLFNEPFDATRTSLRSRETNRAPIDRSTRQRNCP
jgi:acyl-CoA synthetase (AMP-forming)/AMP-acid ligase II